MSIFPLFQFSERMITEFGSFENCFEALVDNFINTKMFFRSWLIDDMKKTNATPRRLFCLFMPCVYQNEEKLSPEKKKELKRYKIKYINKRIKFLTDYKRLIRNDATESEVLDLLIEYEVAGFGGMRKLNEEELWLKKELKTIKGE